MIKLVTSRGKHCRRREGLRYRERRVARRFSAAHERVREEKKLSSARVYYVRDLGTTPGAGAYHVPRSRPGVGSVIGLTKGHSIIALIQLILCALYVWVGRVNLAK